MGIEPTKPGTQGSSGLKTVEDTSGQISFKFSSNIKGARQSLNSFLDRFLSTSTVSILE
ncbi:hypothetical protein SRABI134_04567 [Peribacillus sp. Bi134]|nr:hypothetical protein SRABI134_04567 [Peribacillus sp. Bi134]